MNLKKVINYIGNIFILEAILMLFPFFVSILYKEPNGKYFIYVAFLIFIFGIILRHIYNSDKKFFSAEGFVTASLSWIILSIVGALPFYFSGEIPNLLDAIFETVSGFTTTGATILNNPANLSRCMNFWRCLTHFIGGMGVLVLMLAIINSKGEMMQIMKAESPGPQVGKLLPKVSDTAKVLYIIYILLTLITIVSYYFSGMPIFDSICIGLGTAGTGGFVVTSGGCSDYPVISQILIAIFMLLFGVNFNIYYFIILKKIKIALMSEELRVYFFIVVISIVAIMINIGSIFANVFDTFVNAFFHVSSIITTTGFSIYDYTTWPLFSQCILLVLMLIGGCAGSTAGGFKVSRLIITFKYAYNEIYYQLHPNTVKAIKFEDKVVSNETKRTIVSYTIIYMLIILISVLIISLENFDFATTVSSVFETFNNIGLGISKIGPKGNFSIFSDLSKVVFIILMLTGRLEIFPILMLFSRKTWSRKS